MFVVATEVVNSCLDDVYEDDNIRLEVLER